MDLSARERERERQAFVRLSGGDANANKREMETHQPTRQSGWVAQHWRKMASEDEFQTYTNNQCLPGHKPCTQSKQTLDSWRVKKVLQKCVCVLLLYSCTSLTN